MAAWVVCCYSRPGGQAGILSSVPSSWPRHVVAPGMGVYILMECGRPRSQRRSRRDRSRVGNVGFDSRGLVVGFEGGEQMYSGSLRVECKGGRGTARADASLRPGASGSTGKVTLGTGQIVFSRSCCLDTVSVKGEAKRRTGRCVDTGQTWVDALRGVQLVYFLGGGKAGGWRLCWSGDDERLLRMIYRLDHPSPVP